ncbi:hypothetical protein NO004_250176 [Flavobacterium psychrophilum]|nr:hypothetical protein DK095_150148 [Flavobacterium psychrophilum]SNB07222.1 hypothetical protein JIP1600_1480008 [Flavobacterium psychrophilum]SNB25462.1 hypothetical protein NO004_250176 [Flavobacterium psychrophilum]GEJ31283.1 hypothetical protein FPN187_contig00001-0019 [Flavobacterium psychrophilum]GEJ31647.1 hypothetical protein FPN181_contig00057-0019 [Flavobacterium psychrophilum]
MLCQFIDSSISIIGLMVAFFIDANFVDANLGASIKTIFLMKNKGINTDVNNPDSKNQRFVLKKVSF